MDMLELALGETKSTGYPHTVLFLDLDGFKLINDSLGHRAGDVLLITTAHRLGSVIGSQDVLARIGGDEFAVLLKGKGIEAGIDVANDIINVLKSPLSVGDRLVFSACSIGIAQLSDCNLTAEELLRNADIAMYKAKKHGPGQYAVFAESMHQDVIAALSLQTDLHQAISRDEFRLFFQPICEPTTSRITGVEALIRWQHPERGLLSPLTFIPLAEQIGVIRDIGRWVLLTACLQLAAWNEHFGTSGLRMSVNVSSDELLDVHFIPELERVLEETGISPSTLQLEITESVFLRQPTVIRGQLEAIRSLGVRIALDDFGTGFSSLSYIDQYPVDTIKIDHSFVRRMLTNRRTLVIIETIIRLGKSLDLQIVAEGVETQQQLDTLQALGCVHAQGYLFARPLPAEEITSVIKTRVCRPGTMLSYT
jgi:diguanylate cyclase (GGDEF)-like protein